MATGTTYLPGLGEHLTESNTSAGGLFNISLLPEDILYRIFLNLFVFTERSRRGEYLATITRVCTRWRATALNMPNLWLELNSDWMPLTTLILQRSGALPLSIEYSARNDELFRDRTFADVCGAASRLGSLTLYLTTTAEMTDALDRLDKAGPLSSLKVLELSMGPTQGYDFVRLPITLLVDSHQLETLILRSIIFDWTRKNSTPPTPARSVQSLTLTHSSSHYACYYTFISILSILPSLVTLHCSWTVKGAIGSREREPVQLLSLATLTLTNWSRLHMHSYLPQLLSLRKECIINGIFDADAGAVDMIDSLSHLFPGRPTDIAVVAASFSQSAGSLIGALTMNDSCPVRGVNFFQQDKSVKQENAVAYFEESAFPALMRQCFDRPIGSLSSLRLSGQAITTVLSMLLRDSAAPRMQWYHQPYLVPTLKRLEIRDDCESSVLSMLWETLEARHRHGVAMLEDLTIFSSASKRDDQASDLSLAKIAKIADRVVVEEECA